MAQAAASGVGPLCRPPNAGAVDVQQHLRALAFGLVPLLPATHEFTKTQKWRSTDGGEVKTDVLKKKKVNGHKILWKKALDG